MATVLDARNRVDIIIPTYDNQQQLFQCVESMLVYAFEYPIRIIVVNNGKNPVALPEDKNVIVVEAGDNLGWTGGLRKGLEISDSKYVMFANDDIFIPRSSIRWMKEMVRTLDMYPDVGAVGPSSNVVTGLQNIWHKNLFSTAYTSFLIGFCMLVRREALEKAGGVQDVEFGGDDFDLSMRIRKAGYTLVVDKEVFVYHHGFQTGTKVHGTPDKPGGWNSREMIENTNMELIRKHGFINYHKTILNEVNAIQSAASIEELAGPMDAEGMYIASHVNGGPVVELGCGERKTVPQAIGVDYVAYGEKCPYSSHVSVADVVADVQKPLPFDKDSVSTVIARHILEHCVDVVGTLKNWKEIIKPRGKLIIACPNENYVDGIPLNSQHKHAFTADSLKAIAELVGMKEVERNEQLNGVSFVSVLEKV